jgi:hypothetical protein
MESVSFDRLTAQVHATAASSDPLDRVDIAVAVDADAAAEETLVEIARVIPD